MIKSNPSKIMKRKIKILTIKEKGSKQKKLQ